MVTRHCLFGSARLFDASYLCNNRGVLATIQGICSAGYGHTTVSSSRSSDSSSSHGLVQARLNSNLLAFRDVRSICSTSCSSSSSSSEASGDRTDSGSSNAAAAGGALGEQQRPLPQSVWDRPYQRRLVRRRPKHITAPLAQQQQQHGSTAAAARDLLRAASSDSNDVSSSSSSSSASPSMLFTLRALEQSAANGWCWQQGAQRRVHSPRPRLQPQAVVVGPSKRQKSSQPAFVETEDEAAATANEAAAAAAAMAKAVALRAAYRMQDELEEVQAQDTRLQQQQQQQPHQLPQLQQQQHQQQDEPVPYGWKPAAVYELVEQRQQQQEKQLQQQQQPDASSMDVPVNAVHIGGEVNFTEFCRDYNIKDRIKVTSQARDHAMLEIDEVSEDRVIYGPSKQERSEKRIMVIFRYGSVIFFNVRQRTREAWLDMLKPYIKVPERQGNIDSSSSSSSREAAAKPALRTDEAVVVLRPSMEDFHKLEPDKIVVRHLDVGTTRMISHVLGQSVALDYYNSKVDEAIQNFTPYLRDVAQTGQCDTLKEARLLQLIADNSLLYTDVVTKIGLLDISPTAWANDKYGQLWDSLRLDYEIEKRFETINRKLGPMLENAKFLLDIRAEKKSAEAEWIIIALICLEVAVNLYGHFML